MLGIFTNNWKDIWEKVASFQNWIFDVSWLTQKYKWSRKEDRNLLFD